MKKLSPQDHEEKLRGIDTDESDDVSGEPDETVETTEYENTVDGKGILESTIRDPYKILGKLLQDAREQLQELHPELQQFLREQELDWWCGRKVAGWWSRKKIVELVEDIFDCSEQPTDMLSPFAYNFIWRLETEGTPPNRRMLHTYCYILGFRVQIGLAPLETPGQ